MKFENIDEYRAAMVKGYAKSEYYNGYTKGVKRGIGVGSHKTYNYFIKQGHWEDVTPYIEGYWIEDMDTEDNVIYICSVCDRWVYDTVAGYEYCPFCGVKMHGVKECD